MVFETREFSVLAVLLGLWVFSRYLSLYYRMRPNAITLPLLQNDLTQRVVEGGQGVRV